MSNLYYMEEVGLIGVANNQEIQLWDVKSRAYYGVITVAPPEQIYCRINHVEYLKDFNKIAVVWDELTVNRSNGDTIFVDRLYLFDAITLAPDAVNTLEGGGMAKLLKYKYGNKTILPSLKDEVAVFKYYFTPATGQLLTINRKGEVHIYKNTQWEKMIVTGANESLIIFPAKKGTGFYVTDKYTARLTEIDIKTEKKSELLAMEFIPNSGTRYTQPRGSQLISVTPMPSENTICVLDSTNRMKIIETATSKVISYNLGNFYGMTLLALIPNWTDSSLYAIAEEQKAPYARLSFYTNLKTGITNNFSGGTAAYLSSVSATGLNSKFRMVVSGLNEIEVDLSTLTEKNISHFPTANNESIAVAGNWENGYFQLLKNKTGNEELRVFRKDSATSPLLYSQKLSINNSEMFAGIFPLKKWYITVKALTKEASQNMLHFYDSTGKLLKSIATAVPVQMIQSSLVRKQHIFSADGKYFLIKEITGQVSPFDSCRLRLFSTDDFTTIADLRFTEVWDFNSFNHKTAAFADKVSGFYFISASPNLTGSISNSLIHYSLSGKKAEKKYETKLCLENMCRLTFTVRNISPSKDGKMILWFGFVPADFTIKREAYQFALITNAATGQHQTGMNLPPLPELLAAIPFPGYLGFQYMDRIDFAQLNVAAPVPFLTINPFVNDNTYELSMLYSAYDYKNQKPWYYEKSNNDDCISFRFGKYSFRRKQFDVTFNRPDMVLANVPGYDTLFKQLYFKAVSKRAERVPNMLQNFKPEEMPTLSVEGTKYSPNGNFTINVKIKTLLSINKFYVSINGNRVEKTATIKINKDLPGYEPVHNFFEKLTNGENIIEIIAVTESGIESLPIRISQNHTRASDKPNLFLLAVSVGEYQQGLSQLPYAVKDGRDVTSLIRDLKKDTLVNKIFIDTLFNEAADQQSISKWIQDKKDLSPSDYVILFYSGHGFLDSNLNLRLATSFTDINVPEKRSIDYESILKEMDQLPARQKLLLIDACQSGDFDKKSVVKNSGAPKNDSVGNAKGLIGKGLNSIDNSFEIMQNLFSFSEPGKGTVVISASGGTQSAFEAARYQNGYFTYALKEAMTGGKASDDPYNRLWLNQLVKYLKLRVSEMSGGKQNPNLRISNPDLNWRIK